MTSAVATRPQGVTYAAPDQVTKALQRDDRAAQLSALLAGSGITVERFSAVVLNTMVRNPDLQKATLESVLDAIRVSATLKLEPTGILGEGYILKYGDKAQFEAGYRGLMKLARRSGQVTAMDSQVVYLHDPFTIALGTEPRIEHSPTVEGDRGGYRGAYAWARLTSGELVIDWMSLADIESVRKTSRNGTGSSSPWVAHFGEMARKTVIKRLMKRLPLGTDAEQALNIEAEADQAAQEPVRRPSAAISAIHDRLGIPSTVPDYVLENPPVTVVGAEAVPSDYSMDALEAAAEQEPPPPYEPRATAATGEVESFVATPSPEHDDLCASVSPYDHEQTCIRERGHSVKLMCRDSNGMATWPRPEGWGS